MSSVECLYAHFGLDIADKKVRVACAHDYINYPSHFDTNSHLILLQIDRATAATDLPSGFAELTRALVRTYGAYHEVHLFGAPRDLGHSPIVRTLVLMNLGQADTVFTPTLYLPPIITRRDI